MKELKFKKEGTVKFDTDSKSEIYNEVLKKWEGRAQGVSYNMAHKKSKELQAEFMLGAVAVLDALANDNESQITPYIYFSIMRGDVMVPKKEEDK